MKKVIRLTESDVTRIVKRVIKENEDEDDFVNSIRSFDFGRPKDFTDILRDITYLISDSEDVNDFEMKLEEFTEDNQENIDNLTDDERNSLDRFIDGVMTRHDFNS